MALPARFVPYGNDNMKYRIHIYNTKTLHPHDKRSIIVDWDSFPSMEEASKLVEKDLNDNEAVSLVTGPFTVRERKLHEKI